MSSNISIKRLCQHCGKEFAAKTTITRYCSHICNSRAYKAQVKKSKVEVSNIETKQIKNKPIDEIKAKEFLTVRDVSKLLNSSRQTIYNLINSKVLRATNISKKKTLIKRSEIDRLFELPAPVLPLKESIPERIYFDESECYRLKDIQVKYNISETALQNLIKRENIFKYRKGIHSLVPKKEIDKLLS